MAYRRWSPRRHRPRLLYDGHVPPPPPTQEKETRRDWAELPRDVLLAVFCRLHHADVLTDVEHVCRPWRRAAREEPELWRRVDLRGRGLTLPVAALNAMAYAAARRGAGRCEAFWVEGVRSNSFIFLLSNVAPALKSLRLVYCTIPIKGLNAAIRKLPMLEELELSLYSGAASNIGLSNLAETCAAAAEACPLLTRLRLSRYRFDWQSGIGDGEAMEIAGMRGLRSLQLFANSLGNAGLAAILDGCAGLECLDIRGCFNVEMNVEMRAKCARLQVLRLPRDSNDDYDLRYGDAWMNPARYGHPAMVMYYDY